MAVIKGSDWGGSRLTTAQTCKKKYWWSWEAPHPLGGSGLIAIEDKTAPTKGTLIHTGLQAYYDGLIADAGQPKGPLMLKAIKWAIEAIEEFKLPPELVPLMRDEVISALDQYFLKYENEEDLEPIAAETPIRVEVEDFVHTGIIDLLARWRGTLMIVDHKTTTMALDQFFKKFRFDLSLKGYAKAVRDKYGEKVGVLINGIKFKRDKAMTVELEREPIYFTDDELDHDFPKTVRSVRREIEACHADNYFPKSGAQCVQVWGDCEFRRLCVYEDDSMIKTFYQSRHS